MDLRLRRAMGMLKLGKAADAAEAAAEAGREAGQPPLAAVTVAARVAAAGAKLLCEGEAEEEALDELAALKVPVTFWFPSFRFDWFPSAAPLCVHARVGLISWHCRFSLFSVSTTYRACEICF